jgi:hypothetical protein
LIVLDRDGWRCCEVLEGAIAGDLAAEDGVPKVVAATKSK